MCLARIINVGATEIVCGPTTHSTHEKEKAIVAIIMKNQNITIREYNDVNSIYQTFDLDKNYLKSKVEGQNG